MRMTNGRPNTSLLLLCIIGRDEAVYRASDKPRYSGEGTCCDGVWVDQSPLELKEEREMNLKGVQITWLGHGTFKLRGPSGRRCCWIAGRTTIPRAPIT